jgi:hypothetical protein
MTLYADIKTNSDSIEFTDKDQTTARTLNNIVRLDYKVFYGDRAYLAADQDDIAGAGANNYKINLDTKGYSYTFGLFSSADKGFIIAKSGYYIMLGNIKLEAADITAGTLHQAKIYVDPLGVGAPSEKAGGIVQRCVASTIALVVSVMDIRHLDATDKVYLYIYTSDTNVDIDAGISATFMSIGFLGV